MSLQAQCHNCQAQACRIQTDAQAGGALITVNPLIVQGVAQAMKVQTGGLGGAFVWPSLLRRLERAHPGYAE